MGDFDELEGHDPALEEVAAEPEPKKKGEPAPPPKKDEPQSTSKK